MKDRYHKKANVLGIDVSVMRVDKAVNVSMELMRGKGLPVIYFLSVHYPVCDVLPSQYGGLLLI